jgi:hypothetical protein
MAALAQSSGPSPSDAANVKLRKRAEGRMSGLRVNRYSWWVHWRELADYGLPRRYKWLITPNQAARGSPINQHIIDSTGTLAARNCAAGMFAGTTNPTKRWFKLTIFGIDSTGTNPISLWLKQVEDLLYEIFQQSNFYQAMATFFFDLVIFGTAVVIIYEDFENVIKCFTPCLGEFYLDNDASFRAEILYREFLMTLAQMEEEFGEENLSDGLKAMLNGNNATMLTRENVIGHGIEFNTQRGLGIPSHFKYSEVYWEIGHQGDKVLRKKGFFETPLVPGRWDLVANDAYGRGPFMDALGDVKQLQQETKRKGQAIDKTVNPPMVGDIQLKNAPASLLPGGVTYVSGFAQSGKPGFASVYDMKFPVGEITEDIRECQERIRKILFNDVFQTISQFETRSNVTAFEIDARKAEASLMLGPVFLRIFSESLPNALKRTFGIASRAGILPPAPPEIHNAPISIKFSSMLAIAQEAAAASGIERILGVVGNLAGVQPDAVDKLDADYAIDKYNALLNNDPKLMRSADAVAQIRQQRQKQQQAEQMAQHADTAQKLSAGAKNLSDIDVGGGRNAVQAITGA